MKKIIFSVVFLSLILAGCSMEAENSGDLLEPEGDEAKISAFVSCLADKGLKVYGANWCGWTKKLVVDTFGGFDIVAPFYVECTTEIEKCSAEGVIGYPTIKLNGEVYQGDRTFAGLAAATGCIAPDVQVQVSTGKKATCN